MKRIVVVANVEIMRAFQSGGSPVRGGSRENLSEILLPPDAAAKRRWQGLHWRIEEIAENLAWLVTGEKADAWTFVAPLGLIVGVMPLLDEETASRLAEIRIADLTALTNGELDRILGPRPVPSPGLERARRSDFNFCWEFPAAANPPFDRSNRSTRMVSRS